MRSTLLNTIPGGSIWQNLRLQRNVVAAAMHNLAHVVRVVHGESLVAVGVLLDAKMGLPIQAN